MLMRVLVCMLLCMDMHACVSCECVHIKGISECAHMCVYVCECECVRVCVCAHVRMRTAHVLTHMHIHMHTCASKYLCECV